MSRKYKQPADDASSFASDLTGARGTYSEARGGLNGMRELEALDLLDALPTREHRVAGARR